MSDHRIRSKVRHRSQTRTVQNIPDGSVPDTGKCPHCGIEVRSSWEFCPGCGQPLAPWCTFCGAEIPPGATECPECGMSREGTVCPRCGTRNSGSFCRKCNEPLTPAAAMEVKRAMQDPMFVRAAELAVRLAESAHVRTLTDSSGSEQLPPDILRLKDLLESAGVRTGSDQESAQPAETSITQQPEETVSGPDKERMRAEYEKMKAELDSILSSMVPPPGSTPQQQRNYYSARKITIIRKVRGTSPVAWVCNYCGCRHLKPSECCEPWHGGRWIYEEHTITEQKEL